jgi:site-specific recombinase XerD
LLPGKFFFVACTVYSKKGISFATVLTIKTSKIMKTAGKQPKVKEPVRIRFRQLKNGSQSIYLDIYDKGERSYEFLGMYKVPERSQVDIDRNRETLAQVKIIQAQKIIELQAEAHGLPNTSTRKQKTLLCDFVKHIADKKKEQGGKNPTSTYLHYRTLYSHLLNYSPKATIKDASSKEFCAGFIDYLQTAKGRFTGKELCGNTQFIYVRVFGAVFNQAIKEGIIKENPLNRFDRQELPRAVKQEIPFLTIDEVNCLRNTPCAFPEIKAAYLFSCYTGLRFSDVKSLTWGQLRQVNNKTMLVYTQKKTQKQEYLPLATPALDIINARERKADPEPVFALQDNKEVNLKLKSFAAAAGIDNKKVTFHTARHTAATLLLSLGVPIEVVSKILGHSEIRTTQIYAKVLDKQVDEGMHKLDNIFG